MKKGNSQYGICRTGRPTFHFKKPFPFLSCFFHYRKQINLKNAVLLELYEL